MFIDLDRPSPEIRVLRFPDSQPHINVPFLATPEARSVPIDVRCSITSPEKLMLLLLLANAIDRHAGQKGALSIPYLLGARYDRIMVPGDSLDLEVVADLVNLCGFVEVKLFDVHSDVATALIRRSRNVSNECVVRAAAGKPDLVLILPDAGAAKKASQYQAWNPDIREVVQCQKVRDLKTGRIDLRVPDPSICAGRNCLVIDDLCDGGATFVQIGAQIRPAHLTLAVSHGIFSKGLAPFSGVFHRIVTTDSYPTTNPERLTPPPGLEFVRIPHPL